MTLIDVLIEENSTPATKRGTLTPRQQLRLLASPDYRREPPQEGIAAVVISRISELLDAEVTVVSPQNTVIASSELRREGELYRGRNGAIALPLQMANQHCQVIVDLSDDNGAPRHLACALIELVIGKLSNTYKQSAKERKACLIHDLLLGLLTNEPGILDEASALGMDLNQARAVILIDAAAYILADTQTTAYASDELTQQRADNLISTIVRFFHLPNDTICAYIGNGHIAILKASNTRNLAPWVERNDPPGLLAASWTNLHALRRASEALLTELQYDTDTALSIGIGRYHPGIFGLTRSYQDAYTALELGHRFHGQGLVHGLDQLGAAAFIGLADDDTKRDLATHLLSPLDHEQNLITTLMVFFAADCNVSVAAARLSIHRNTLSYRFDKIASLTGLDPRRFDDAVQIRLALLLRNVA